MVMVRAVTVPVRTGAAASALATEALARQETDTNPETRRPSIA
jgi:hypothetical protein